MQYFLLENLKPIITQVAQSKIGALSFVRLQCVLLIAIFFSSTEFFHIGGCDYDAQLALMWKQFQFLMLLFSIYLHNILLKGHRQACLFKSGSL